MQTVDRTERGCATRQLVRGHASILCSSPYPAHPMKVHIKDFKPAYRPSGGPNSPDRRDRSSKERGERLDQRRLERLEAEREQVAHAGAVQMQSAVLAKTAKVRAGARGEQRELEGERGKVRPPSKGCPGGRCSISCCTGFSPRSRPRTALDSQRAPLPHALGRARRALDAPHHPVPTCDFPPGRILLNHPPC